MKKMRIMPRQDNGYCGKRQSADNCIIGKKRYDVPSEKVHRSRAAVGNGKSRKSRYAGKCREKRNRYTGYQSRYY